ncbi:MAG: PEGA domain-containing protein [Pseudomonadota bacterium]
MKFKLRGIIVGVAAVAIGGCASIMHGTSQKIGISSSPTGATVTVDNKPLGNTPLFADLKRGEEHIVTIEMAGYEKSQLTLTKSVSGWVWGNIVFGGLIGLAVDAISGGLYNLSPEQLNAELRKNGANVSSSKDGIIVVAVLRPDPAWQKIGSLAHQR